MNNHQHEDFGSAYLNPQLSLHLKQQYIVSQVRFMLRFSSLWPHCRFPTVSCGLSIVPVKKGMMIRGLGVGEVSQNRDTVRDDASAKFGAFVSFWLIICSCRPQDGIFMELRHAYLFQVFFCCSMPFICFCRSYANRPDIRFWQSRCFSLSG